MLRCSNCDTLLSEKDLVAVTIGERTFVACPSCLLEFLEETQDDIEEIPEDEERYIQDEWDADERYDEMALRGAV